MFHANRRRSIKNHFFLLFVLKLLFFRFLSAWYTIVQSETDGRRNLFDCFSVTRCHIFHTTIRVSPNFFYLTSTARRKAETEAKRSKKKDTCSCNRVQRCALFFRHSWDPISNSRSNVNIARHFFEADHCPKKKPQFCRTDKVSYPRKFTAGLLFTKLKNIYHRDNPIVAVSIKFVQRISWSLLRWRKPRSAGTE